MKNNWDLAALLRAENIGVYEYKVKGCHMIYYSYFGKSEGFIRIDHNLRTHQETRKPLRYVHIPKFLIAENGGTKYNYMCG